MALQKNQEFNMRIDAISAEGYGIGRVDQPDGRKVVVFVPFTAVGDVIVCRIVKVQKNFAYGKMMALVTPSADRLPAPDCAVFGKCGGCAFRHVSYEAELRYKWQRVSDAMQRIAGWDGDVEPIVGCVTPDRYRNKAQYPVTVGETGLRAGFYAIHSHRVIEQTDCLLQPAVFSRLVQTVLDWANEYGVAPYDEMTHTGLLRHIYIRQGRHTGQVMVCLVCTSGKLPHTDKLVENLCSCDENVVSVSVNLNRRDTNVVLGRENFVLYGTAAIEDTLCDMTFSLSPNSFYQVNRDQAEILYGLAAREAALTGRETVLDLYCGTGTIGLSMAHKAGQIIGVEVVAAAIEDARRNAARNGVDNARFICADAAEAARQLKAEGLAPDVVIVDPPRKGCDESVLETIAEMNPKRVVYVSCDPATLARDCKRLSALGYAVRRVTPVDMFPRTAHVESVVLLERDEQL